MAHGPDNAEVSDENVATDEHDVLRLQIEMEDAVGVRVGQRVDDPHQHPDRLAFRQRAVAHQPLPLRVVLDIGHDVVEVPVGLPGVEQLEDVGMLEPGCALDLTPEPRGPDRRRTPNCAPPG